MTDPYAVGSQRDGQRLIQKCEELLKSAREAREPFEADWYLNVAFFEGEHWLTWSRSRRFARPILERWRVMFTDNRVQPAVLSEVAKLTKNRPTWEAVPTSADDVALDDALLTQRVLQAKWEDLKLQPLLRRVTTWSRVTGAGFWKVTWDPEMGDGSDVAIDKQSGEPVENPQKGGLLRREDLPEDVHGQFAWQRLAPGDVRVNVRSPFDIYVDPLAGDEGMQSVRWLIEEAVRAPEDVAQRYGVQPPAPDAASSPGLVQSNLPGAQRDGRKVGVRVWELWARPCAEYPQGRHVVWCAGKLLAFEPNPTLGGGLPYVMFVGVPVPGRFWPTSMTSQIRPLNRELNKTRSQMRENANRFGNPALLVPQDLQNFQWNGAPGEQVPFDPWAQQIPQFLVPPRPPGNVTDEVGLIEGSIDKVSHQAEVSRGQVPAGVTAASAIQLLQEADQTIIAMDSQDFEQSISEAGRLMLDLICRFYKQERLIQIGGEDEDWDISSFRADQLKRDVPTVQVKPGSMIPRSVAARQALMEHILTLFLQNGVRMDPAALGQFLREFEVGGLESLISGFSDDARQIAAENAELRNGGDPKVEWWHNHAAHIAGHEREMKSKRFRVADEETKARFRDHLASHHNEQVNVAIKDARDQLKVQAAAQPPMPTVSGGTAPPELGAGPPVDVSGGSTDAIDPNPAGGSVPAAPEAPPAG